MADEKTPLLSVLVDSDIYVLLRESEPKVLVTCCGKIRSCNAISRLEWVYLVGSILVLSISLGITIERFTVTKPCECDFAFGLLLLLTIMFCYYYVMHSVLTERWDELFVFVASKGIVIGYCIVNYINGERDTLQLIRLILACSAGPISVILGLYICYKYFESNHFIQNSVGGSDEVQKKWRIYYVCSSLLKFDLQLQWSMLILVMGKSILDLTLYEKIIFGSGVPVIFLVFILGKLGIYYKSKKLMIGFYTLSVFERGYLIYNFYYTYTKGDNVGATYNPVFVFGVFAVLVWISLCLTTGYFMLHRPSRNDDHGPYEFANDRGEFCDESGYVITNSYINEKWICDNE